MNKGREQASLPESKPIEITSIVESENEKKEEKRWSKTISKLKIP